MNQKPQEADIKTMSVEQALIDSLSELRDSMKAGQKLEERFTMRTVDLQLETHDYDGDGVRAIRDKLRVSQSVFAKLIGVKPKTIQSWEQGMVPPPMARRLLGLIDEDPERWINLLRQATKEHVKS